MNPLIESGDDILDATATELSARIGAGELSPVEVMQRTLARIEALQPELNAFVTVDANGALAAARAAEAAIARGERLGPLHGLPYHAKDLIPTAGMTTTMGTTIFADNVPPEDAVPVARLKAAGAILVGKTTTPAFGHKPLTEGVSFGRTLNPWDPARTCGGSSGGAAVAVVTGQGALGLGTDGGGSVRIPAACCGIVGLKATLGVIPHIQVPDLFGANSFIGPMTRNVADARLLFDAIAGPDRRDPYSQTPPPPPADGDYKKLSELRIAYLPRVGNQAIDPECLGAADRAAAGLAEAGAAVGVEKIDFVALEDAFLVILESALRTRLEPYLAEWADRIDPSLRQTVENGAAWSAVDLQRAAAARSACFRAVQALFERYDALLTPTLAAPPLFVDQDPHERVQIAGQDAGRIRAAWYPYTYPFNLTGHPAITLPAGLTTGGLPLAVQLVAPWHGEPRLFDLAAFLEQTQGVG